MKKTAVTIVFSLLAYLASAQYQLDLSEMTPVPLKYIKMGDTGAANAEIRITNRYMEIGGVPQLPVMGEFHYSRMDHRYWKDALLKMKSTGVNIVSTYAIWSLHEEFEGEQSWNGNLNLRHFVTLCQELGLKVHLRFGPYCNAEIRNGGLPDWIVTNDKFRIRSNDPLYLEYVGKWYADVYNQVGHLQYKDGGPIMALQLENEYVTEGMVISHLLKLKQMAMEVGFDLPLYTMTHWMSSEYPKGEIIPYAGHYIETPWTAHGKNELPTLDVEFFSYNRVSSNIGTDIIKIENGVESLGRELSDSPYFTCEVGVGTTAFYHRRAVVPEEMAGENINLRLGCGVNLMGYYMYVGGSNPVGLSSTLQSSGPRVGYDYQAPVREFGTMGDVMGETKKYNYFMNDFGSALAPTTAYLPVSNQNRDNLQWAVRTDGASGFVFCSNYLYKHDRADYDSVQFRIKIKHGEVAMPARQVRVTNGSYFLWPFNLMQNGVTLRYSTTQPICTMSEQGGVTTSFFFQDDNINAEYLIDKENVKSVNVTGGVCRKQKDGYFIDQMTPGMDCVIKIKKHSGETLYFVTLTSQESDHIWKGNSKGKDFVIITPAALVYDNQGITLISPENQQQAWVYSNGRFEHRDFETSKRQYKASFEPIAPMAEAQRITPTGGNMVCREFDLNTLSQPERVYLRSQSAGVAECLFNGSQVKLEKMGEYNMAQIANLVKVGRNSIRITLAEPAQGVMAEIEILLKNGQRIVWNSNSTWTSQNPREPVNVIEKTSPPTAFAPDEKLAIYRIKSELPACDEQQVRMYISYKGDVVNAYINGRLVNDSFYDGTKWILGVGRYNELAHGEPLIIRIEGLKSADEQIYFEKWVNPAECVHPSVSEIDILQEYHFKL